MINISEIVAKTEAMFDLLNEHFYCRMSGRNPDSASSAAPRRRDSLWASRRKQLRCWPHRLSSEGMQMQKRWQRWKRRL